MNLNIDTSYRGYEKIVDTNPPKLNGNFKDLTGKIFALIHIDKYAGHNKFGKPLYYCTCNCKDHTKFVGLGEKISRGDLKSCGCLIHKSPASKTHGMSGSRLHQTWKRMRGRCNNPNSPDYPNYGGRGIKVCKEWDSFENFYNWAYTDGGYSDYYEEHPEIYISIDRKDRNGDYCPENCRFADRRLQNLNNSQNWMIQINNHILPLSIWVELNYLPYNVVENRLRVCHWDIESALSTPNNPDNRNVIPIINVIIPEEYLIYDKYEEYLRNGIIDEYIPGTKVIRDLKYNVYEEGNLMNSFKALHKEIIKNNINISRLVDWKDQFIDFAKKVETSNKINIEELKYFIKLCLDYYTYSSNGDVLIPDYTYDMCVNRYYQETGIDRNNDTMYLPDPVLNKSKAWDFVQHRIFGLVGSLNDKLYTYQEVKDRVKYFGCSQYKIAPKYDGISVAIQKENGKIVYAATRYDGMQGQDIRELVKRAKFPKWWKDAPDGYYKNEILMSTEDYDELIHEKYYANRRSAVSGIVNTPTNLQYAKYLTIMPLLYYDRPKQEIHYIAAGIETVNVYSPRDLMDAIEKKLEFIRSADFPYRVDGVVIYPQVSYQVNEGDLMGPAFAYKVNTNEARTTIEYAYASVGRLGSVTPMVHVKPVEVNETTVTDVSLGSYAKFLSMNLRENEEVIIYSAGDVIPQLKLPDMRVNWNNSDELKISKYCPYCGERFERIGTEYRCSNPNCIRVMSGRISNFLIKLGIDGFSDKTFELLCNAKLIRSLPDVFELTPDKIESVDGFDTVSAHNLYDELQRIKNDRIQISEFFGALGIEGISTKKCRKILSEIDIGKFLRKLAEDKGKKKAIDAMRCADGIGAKTAVIFVEYVADNLKMINRLLEVMNVVGDTSYVGEICFTGFRNSRWEEKFNSIGYKIGDSVNSDTTCLISASADSTSSKTKSAMKKGIPIFTYNDIEEVFDRLKNGESLIQYLRE